MITTLDRTFDRLRPMSAGARSLPVSVVSGVDVRPDEFGAAKPGTWSKGLFAEAFKNAYGIPTFITDPRLGRPRPTTG